MVAVNDAFRSLFLYAANNNMVEMAVMFWGYGKDATMKALVGQLIFRKMHIRTGKKGKEMNRKESERDDIRRELRKNER